MLFAVPYSLDTVGPLLYFTNAGTTRGSGDRNYFFATPLSASRELLFACFSAPFIMIRETRGLITHNLHQI
jgi:hypothetical protein